VCVQPHIADARLRGREIDAASKALVATGSPQQSCCAAVTRVCVCVFVCVCACRGRLLITGFMTRALSIKTSVEPVQSHRRRSHCLFSPFPLFHFIARGDRWATPTAPTPPRRRLFPHNDGRRRSPRWVCRACKRVPSLSNCFGSPAVGVVDNSVCCWWRWQLWEPEMPPRLRHGGPETMAVLDGSDAMQQLFEKRADGTHTHTHTHKSSSVSTVNEISSLFL